jgi:hypothetical protein
MKGKKKKGWTRDQKMTLIGHLLEAGLLILAILSYLFK